MIDYTAIRDHLTPRPRVIDLIPIVVGDETWPYFILPPDERNWSRHAPLNLGPGGECPCVRPLETGLLFGRKVTHAKADCDICAGSGTIPDPAPTVVCEMCNGERIGRFDLGGASRYFPNQCPTCLGHGRVRAVRRERCGCGWEHDTGGQTPWGEFVSEWQPDPDCTACHGTGDVEIPEDYQFDDDRHRQFTRDWHRVWDVNFDRLIDHLEEPEPDSPLLRLWQWRVNRDAHCKVEHRYVRLDEPDIAGTGRWRGTTASERMGLVPWVMATLTDDDNFTAGDTVWALSDGRLSREQAEGARRIGAVERIDDDGHLVLRAPDTVEVVDAP